MVPGKYAESSAEGARDARHILAGMPAALLVVDPRGVIRMANEHAVAILQRTRDALEGHDACDTLGALAERMLLAPSGHEDWDLPFPPQPPRRTIDCHWSRVDGEVVAVFRDISHVVRLREERDKLLGLAALGEAMPSLLHELKNPLAAVTATVEVLLEEVAPGDVRDQLYAVLGEVRRMSLGMEGIGSVHGELRARRHAAVDFAIREACRVLAARAQNAGVHFRWDVKDMPLLPFDPAVVRAMVFNFVTNALHACERNATITLHARLAAGGQSRLELTVVDTGSGMAPAVLARATELFFTTKPSGSGIGLALCRRAIEQAGGTLELRSVPGFGTSVLVQVPARDEAAGASPRGGHNGSGR